MPTPASPHLTLRNLPPDVASKLRAEARRRGASLNQTAVDILRVGLGVAGPRSNGLGRLGGAWSPAEADAFDAAVAFTAEIDEELWR